MTLLIIGKTVQGNQIVQSTQYGTGIVSAGDSLMTDGSECPQYDEIITRENHVISAGCDENGVLKSNFWLDGYEFDIDRAIPAGEDFIWKTIGTYGAHRIDYDLVTLTVRYPVKVNVSQRLIWTEPYGSEKSEVVNYSEYYCVERQVTYSEVNSAVIYCPKKVIIDSDATGTIEKSFFYYNEDGMKAGWRYGDMVYPEYTQEISITPATIVGNGARPEILQGAFKEAAEAAVGDFTGTYQEIRMDNKEVLDKDGYSFRDLTVSCPIEGEVILPKTVENKNYEVKAAIVYQEYHIDKDGAGYRAYLIDNPCPTQNANINVWTPVIFEGVCVDNKSISQVLTPDKSMAELVLGNRFKVNAKLEGNHLEEFRGYGSRNYSKYIDRVEVSFSFPVIQKGEYIYPWQWTTMGDFTLPVEAMEGYGTIKIRAFAINYSEGKKLGYEANSLRQEYGAVVEIPVELSGQLKEFELGEERITAESLPYFRKVFKKGESVRLAFNTVGQASEAAMIDIMPSFYGFVGGEKKKLKLYSATGDNYVTFELQNSQNYNNSFVGRLAIPTDAVAVEADFDLEGYKASQIVLDDDPCYYRGLVVVNLDITTKAADYSSHLPLSYSNLYNASQGYLNRWAKEGYRERSAYNYGDVAIFNLGNDIRESYVIVGTH